MADTKKRVLRKLKDNSGASFIFVLGVMLLLMAIGVSVMVAASANVGFLQRQKEYSQVMLLDSSVHKNIMYALQRDKEDDEEFDDLLSWQLAMALYSAKEANPAPDDRLGDITDLEITIRDESGGEIDIAGGVIGLESVTLSFPEQYVTIKSSEPAIAIEGDDDDGDGIADIVHIPREPKTAEVDAKMVVTVVINAGSRRATSRAIYKYTGGKLSDDPDGIYSDYEGDIVPPPPMTLTEFGEWRLIKYEKVDA